MVAMNYDQQRKLTNIQKVASLNGIEPPLDPDNGGYRKRTTLSPVPYTLDFSYIFILKPLMMDGKSLNKSFHFLRHHIL